MYASWCPLISTPIISNKKLATLFQRHSVFTSHDCINIIYIYSHPWYVGLHILYTLLLSSRFARYKISGFLSLLAPLVLFAPPCISRRVQTPAPGQPVCSAPAVTGRRVCLLYCCPVAAVAASWWIACADVLSLLSQVQASIVATFCLVVSIDAASLNAFLNVISSSVNNCCMINSFFSLQINWSLKFSIRCKIRLSFLIRQQNPRCFFSFFTMLIKRFEFSVEIYSALTIDFVSFVNYFS